MYGRSNHDMDMEPIDMNSTTTSQAATAPAAERLHVDHEVTKRLGRWTSASQFDVRVRSGVLVLDLRSPEVTGDVEVRLDLHRSTVKLLLAEGDQVDHWGLDWSGRGRVKDDRRPAERGGRQVRRSAHAEDSPVRGHRGGMAALPAPVPR